MKKLVSFILCAAAAFSVMCCLPPDGACAAPLTAYAAEKQYNTDLLPYAYDKLAEKEQRYYLKMRQAVIDHKTSLDIAMPVSTFKKLANVLMDTDVLTNFAVLNIRYSYSGGQLVGMSFDYGLSKNEYEKVISKAEKAAEYVNSKFTKKMTEYDKVKYIHDYIVRKAVYDLKQPNANNIYGAIYKKKAKCDGYSHAFDYLCRRAGIDVVTVVGYSRGEGHAWNKVNIDGKWYNIDVTWDDPTSLHKENSNYIYFLLSDKQISADHKQADVEYSVPKATVRGADYYSRNGLSANDIDEAKKILVSGIAEAAKEGKNSFVMRLGNRKTYDEVLRRFGKEDDMFPLLIQAEKKSGVDIAEKYYQYLAEEDVMYTFTVYFFYPDTDMSDYFNDVSKLDAGTLKYLKLIGLEQK